MFQAEDPGRAILQGSAVESDDAAEGEEDNIMLKPEEDLIEPDNAGIRIDLTRIGGQK